jgi:hypothetical protein
VIFSKAQGKAKREQSATRKSIFPAPNIQSSNGNHFAKFIPVRD